MEEASPEAAVQVLAAVAVAKFEPLAVLQAWAVFAEVRSEP